MKFAIITHVVHSNSKNQYFAYAPYVREMNIWLKYTDSVIVVAPLTNNRPTVIDSFYKNQQIDFRTVPDFNIKSLKNTLITVLKITKISVAIFKAMQQADHIHLRCPGNVGLIACIVQLFFPSKSKTAKYAGNWDPKSKQPWTYRLQRWILSNTFLTRNMQVLVYGEWENQTMNILPFFTASYSEIEKESLLPLKITDTTIRMVFAGTLVEGKNPMYAVQLVEELRKLGHQVILDIFGEGELGSALENYIGGNHLQKFVVLHANQPSAVLKKAYQKSHFVILPSKSEGWPKAIAEGMFWGCVPLATPVSCVSDMLDQGKRGILLQMDLDEDVTVISKLINNSGDFEMKRKAALHWSGQYTTDSFEQQIKKLLNGPSPKN